MASLPVIGNKKYKGGWAERHNSALMSAVPGVGGSYETSLVSLMVSWEHYALIHKIKFNVTIGQDSVFAPAWQQMGESILTLLNGELGRLDAGTCDRFIRDTMTENGIEVEA